MKGRKGGGEAGAKLTLPPSGEKTTLKKSSLIRVKAAIFPTRTFCKVETGNIGLGFLVFFFLQFFFRNFRAALLINCSLLLSLLKDFFLFLFAFYLFCIFLLRFPSSVLAISYLKERVQNIE